MKKNPHKNDDLTYLEHQTVSNYIFGCSLTQDIFFCCCCVLGYMVSFFIEFFFMPAPKIIASSALTCAHHYSIFPCHATQKPTSVNIHVQRGTHKAMSEFSECIICKHGSFCVSNYYLFFVEYFIRNQINLPDGHSQQMHTNFFGSSNYT